jgi:hypothetical protein
MKNFKKKVEFLKKWFKSLSKTKKIILGAVAFLFIIIFIGFSATQGITEVANLQLKALRSDDLVKAYAYTSRDFQSATSLDDFKQFIAGYPSLRNNKDASFTDRQVENNMGKLKGTLNSRDGSVTPVEYTLVKENGEWKILNMKLNPVGAGIQQTDTFSNTGKDNLSVGTINDVKLNDQTDPRGIVTNHKDKYFVNTAEIFVSAFIGNAVSGGSVTAELVHQASGSKVGPVSNPIQGNGEIASNFSFMKPTKGWPQGTYKVTITLSTGESKYVTFEVK